MIEELINIPPSTSMIDSIRNSSDLTLKKGLSELIDNSIDSGATRIEITVIESGNIEIKDNGCGMDKDDLAKALIYGKSIKQSDRGKIGKYGVGFKHTAIRFSMKTIVKTKKEGFPNIHAIIDWNEIRDSNEWNFPFKRSESVSKSKPGTSIKLLNGSRIGTRVIAQTMRLINEGYHYAIKNGVSIYYNNERLTAKSEPSMITKSLKYWNGEWEGRNYTLSVGIIKNAIKGGLPVKRFHGLTVLCSNKVIIGANVDRGFYDHFEPNVRVFLDLDQNGSKEWTLSTHKDEVLELDDFIESVFYEKILPTLKEAEKVGKELTLSSIQNVINDKLSGLFGGKKVLEKRDFKKRDLNGKGVEPKDSGSKRETADKIDPFLSGSVKSDGVRGLKVFISNIGDQYEMVNVQGVKVFTIRLNTYYEQIKNIVHNSSKNEESILGIVLMAAASYTAQKKPEKYMNMLEGMNEPTDHEIAMRLYSMWMAKININELSSQKA